MRTHAQVLTEAGSDAEVSATLGVKSHQPRDWRLRNSIPPENWRSVVAAGYATMEELLAGAELRASARRTKGDIPRAAA